MKNKLVILSLLFAITCSGQVYSMEDDDDSFQDLKQTVIKLNFKPYEKVNGRLPYKFSEREINAMSYGSQKRIPIEKWYILVKYTFNILKQNSEELTKMFFSSENDNKLIDYAIDIMSNYFKTNPYPNENLYKFKQLDIQGIKPKISISDIENFFNKACNNEKGMKYVRDIIHNNVYSVVIDSLIKKIDEELESHKPEYSYKTTITRKINKVLGEIKDQQRKNIVERSLIRYYLHEHQNISVENINNYWLMIQGVQDDIYDNYRSHVLVSNIDMKIYNDLAYYGDLAPYGKTIKAMISDGYITAPEIIDDVLNPQFEKEAYNNE